MCYRTPRAPVSRTREQVPVHKRYGLTIVALALLAVGAHTAEAQQTRPRPDTVELQLVYEREVFTYRAAGRQDPFRPLTNSSETGPRFEELELRGIIFSTGRAGSVAILGDAGGRVHRVRVGDVVGNSRVVEIGPLRVVLAVENFGNIRQEMLELNKRGGGE